MEFKHPAISAWCELHPEGVVPGQLEVIREDTRRTTVCRLRGVGEAGTNVIAKRTPQRTARIERTIYEEILPYLSLPMLHYYGFVKESQGRFWWLFIEDVSGEEKYRSYVQEHRVAAAEWLGVLHTSARSITKGIRFPERKPKHYLDLLQSAHSIIQSYVANPTLNGEKLPLLEAIISHCEYLMRHWSQFATIDQGMPRTLIHGDFIGNNVRIQTSKEGIVVFPFDWEKAGWGIPAEDFSNVDLKVYWFTVREHWSKLSFKTLTRIANIGKIYRCIVYLDWIAPRLARKSAELLVDDLTKCDVWLTDLIHAKKWRD